LELTADYQLQKGHIDKDSENKALLAEATLNQLHVAHVKIPKTCFFHLIKFKQDKKRV